MVKYDSPGCGSIMGSGWYCIGLGPDPLEVSALVFKLGSFVFSLPRHVAGRLIMTRVNGV